MAKIETAAKKSTATAAKKPRASKKKDAPLVVALETVAGMTESDNSELASLLADLSDELPGEMAAMPGEIVPSDEVIEPTLAELQAEALAVEPTVEAIAAVEAEVVAAIVEAEAIEAPIDAELAAIVGTVEATEHDLDAAIGAVEVAEHYAAADGDAEAAGGAPSASEPATTGAAAESTKPKKERKERIHFSDKVDRIKHRLGDKLGDYMLLEVSDAMLEGEALEVAQNDTLDILKGMNVKEKNRASLLLDFAAGKSSKLNEVMCRALDVLAADGKIVTGDKGNLHLNLIAKPYSPSAARAMGRNTVNVFAKLKLVTSTAKGEYVANPDSLLLAKVVGTRDAMAAAGTAPAAEPETDAEAA